MEYSAYLYRFQESRRAARTADLAVVLNVGPKPLKGFAFPHRLPKLPKRDFLTGYFDYGCLTAGWMSFLGYKAPKKPTMSCATLAGRSSGTKWPVRSYTFNADPGIAS